MRVLAANKFYFVRGGADRCFFDLNDLLESAGHEVAPFSMLHDRNLTTPYQQYFVDEVRYWESQSILAKAKAAGRVLFSLQARRQAQRLIKAWRPDVAHIHLIYHHMSPSFLPVLRDAGIPVVQTVHDYKPVCPTYSMVAHGAICERCKGGKFYQAIRTQCNRGSLSASTLNALEMYLHHALGWYDIPRYYIAPSRFMRAKLIEFGMRADHIVHVSNFVDPERFPIAEGESDNRYYAYVGRLVAVKGIATLIRAAGLRGGGERLLIVGEGPQREELEQLAAAVAPDRVGFLGYQSGDRLQEIVLNASAIVLPSEWYENCPMAVLEAMAMGKAVIGSRIGGIPDLIDDGNTGRLFEMGNADALAAAIDDVLGNEQVRRDMGLRARERVETEFSPREHLRRTLEVYELARSS